jgi:ATP-dependent Clp protease ATP-binding subunit ClpC
LREQDGLAASVLVSFGLTVELVRVEVVRIVGSGEEDAGGMIPFTARAKRVLELSLTESVSLGHKYIGTEHVLLGLLREGEGVAVQILVDLDVEADAVHGELLRLLST